MQNQKRKVCSLEDFFGRQYLELFFGRCFLASVRFGFSFKLGNMDVSVTIDNRKIFFRKNGLGKVVLKQGQSSSSKVRNRRTKFWSCKNFLIRICIRLMIVEHGRIHKFVSHVLLKFRRNNFYIISNL